MKMVNFSIYEKTTKFDKTGKKLITQWFRVDYKDKWETKIYPENQIFERIRMDGIMAWMVWQIKKSTMKRFKLWQIHPRIDKKLLDKFDEKYIIEVHYKDIIDANEEQV